jgi:ArsR family transcriptional regulator
MSLDVMPDWALDREKRVANMAHHRKGHSLSPKEARLVRMFKALGNPLRFQIVKTLAECQPCLTYQIVEMTPLAQSTVSQHLKVLQEAGLVQSQAEGPATCYWLAVDGIRWLKDQIEGWLPGCCVPMQEIFKVQPIDKT